jgi:hypothetical protein
MSTNLTHGPAEKNSFLQMQGYYEDTAGHFGPTIDNTGFEERNYLFRKNHILENEYKASGHTFMAKLQHELCNIAPGLPPGVKVHFELTLSSQNFLLLHAKDDTKYKVKLLNIMLYIPVAQISATVYDELFFAWSNNKEPISFDYRRVDIKNVPIEKGLLEFYSESLYPGALHSKIFLKYYYLIGMILT